MAAQPAVVFTRDPEASKLVAAQHRAAFRAAIVEAVPPEFKIPWSKGNLMPSVTEAGWKTLAALPIGGLQKLSAEGRRWLFVNDSAATEAEKGEGMLPGISRAPDRGPGLFSASELTALFTEQILPSQLKQSSRKGYWGLWLLTLSWGLAHEQMHRLLPMSMEDVQAFVMELMMLGMSANSLKNVMSCLEARHRLFGLTPPLVAARAFNRLFKAIASVTGATSRIRFPVGTHQLLQMMALQGTSALERRAIMIVCIGTVCCSRVDELAQMQMCDLLWNWDAAYHQSLWAALAIRIIRRKQDSGRYGLYVRIPAGQLLVLFRAYLTDMGLLVDRRCTKEKKKGARCPYCDPVWPRTIMGRLASAGPEPIAGMSKQQISGAVKMAIEALNIDGRQYSGISMRRGGITAAVQAGIAPAILHLQSGHGTATSSMGYVDPVDPRELYQTGKAILGLGP